MQLKSNHACHSTLMYKFSAKITFIKIKPLCETNIFYNFLIFC